MVPEDTQIPYQLENEDELIEYDDVIIAVALLFELSDICATDHFRLEHVCQEDEFENSANKANYEELGEHIKLLSREQRLKDCDNQIEDLEDYYERALQLRMMHNNTLTRGKAKMG